MDKVEGAGGSRADGPLMVPPDLSLRLSRPRSGRMPPLALVLAGKQGGAQGCA